MSSVSETGNEVQGTRIMSQHSTGCQEDSDFMRHLKKVSEIVEKWPAWERAFLASSNTSPSCSYEQTTQPKKVNPRTE